MLLLHENTTSLNGEALVEEFRALPLAQVVELLLKLLCNRHTIPKIVLPLLANTFLAKTQLDATRYQLTTYMSSYHSRITHHSKLLNLFTQSGNSPYNIVNDSFGLLVTSPILQQSLVLDLFHNRKQSMHLPPLKRKSYYMDKSTIIF